MAIREVIFRGKRADNGEWVEGDLLQTRYHSGHIEYQIMPQTPVSSAYPVIPETVGQYTGLTDKNGKGIFEGDIVIERGGESYQGYYEIDNVLIVKIPDTLVDFVLSYDCEYKIIGNIHDNPELLGEVDT